MADTLQFLWSGSLMAFLTAVLCGAAAYFVTSRQPSAYDATSTVYATGSGGSDRWLGNATYTPARLDANAYGFAVVSDSVLTDALSIMGNGEATFADAGRLASRISVSLDETSSASFIHITVRESSPSLAAETANAVAAALVRWDDARASTHLNQIAATLESQLASLEEAAVTLERTDDPLASQELAANEALRIEQRNSLRLIRAMAGEKWGSLAVFQPATPPFGPSAPRPMMNTVLGFVFGMIVGYGVVLIYQTVRSRRRDVATLLVRG